MSTVPHAHEHSHEHSHAHAHAQAPALVVHSEREIVDAVRHAYEQSTPLRIEGSGTWLHGGGPFATATPLRVRAHTGVVEYVPGDLVITVRAGTTVAELGDVTGEHGQTLALTPYGTPQATIASVIATAATAPLPLNELTIRDLVLGMTTVSGTGDVVHAGGRVVKNVAGFDLVRLHTGAWGTLGVITEVSLRLHARPALDTVVMGPLTRELGDVLPALVANRAPLPMLVRLAPNAPPQLLARISGNGARAAALEARLAHFGVTSPTVVALGTALHTLPLLDAPPDAVVLRMRTALSDAVPFVHAARTAFPAAELTFDVARGTVRAVIPATAAPSVDRDTASLYSVAAQAGVAHRITVIVEQGRPVAPTPDRLDAQIKRAFDPGDILNRRRFT